MASSLARGVDLSSLVDPIFYGALISVCLFGICISQTWTYFNTNDDRWPLQSIIGFLLYGCLLLEQFNRLTRIRLLSALVFGCTLLETLMLHHYFIANFGNILEFTLITPELSVLTLFTLVVTVMSDLIFASRVWRLQRVHWSFTAIIVATAIGALIPGIKMVNAVFTVPRVSTLIAAERKIEVGFINILAALSQCTATAALWWSFKAHMSEVMNTPQTILQRLMMIAVNRGALLTICQLMVAFMYFYHPEKFYWAPFHSVLAPLYYTTMLATLNARNEFGREKKDLPVGQSTTNLFGTGTYRMENDVDFGVPLPSLPVARSREDIETGYGSSGLVKREVNKEKEENESTTMNLRTFLVVNPGTRSPPGSPPGTTETGAYNPYSESENGVRVRGCLLRKNYFS
uniref:DUF6534 domain-containing protein n=1 Tax=Moniliophthora roreri TaxID=221103 RepID=A0A0W0G0M9_MONRR